MQRQPHTSLPRRDRAALALLAALALACLIAAAALTTQVLTRLDDHASADRDNLPWTISQLEVDQMRLRLALARLDPAYPPSRNCPPDRYPGFADPVSGGFPGSKFQV